MVLSPDTVPASEHAASHKVEPISKALKRMVCLCHSQKWPPWGKEIHFCLNPTKNPELRTTAFGIERDSTDRDVKSTHPGR